MDWRDRIKDFIESSPENKEAYDRVMLDHYEYVTEVIVRRHKIASEKGMTYEGFMQEMDGVSKQIMESIRGQEDAFPSR